MFVGMHVMTEDRLDFLSKCIADCEAACSVLLHWLSLRLVVSLVLY
jgi:hypothetical protein